MDSQIIPGQFVGNFELFVYVEIVCFVILLSNLLDVSYYYLA